jgi:preprotein translocase subunit SecE
MIPLFTYLRETRAEMSHVSWPTRTQTIVYTVFVSLLSVGISLYLGAADYFFTSALTHAIETTHHSTVVQTPAPVASPATTPAPTSEPNFAIPLATSTTK